MDCRLSAPPVKKFRGINDLSKPILECRREFPLPHKFPSMNRSSSMRNFKVKNYGTVAISYPETPADLNEARNKEIITNGLKKLRLKTIDGKDLGEVKVQFLTSKSTVTTKNTVVLEQSRNHRRTNPANLSAASANGSLNSSPILLASLEKSQNYIAKPHNAFGSQLAPKSISANNAGAGYKKSFATQEKAKSIPQRIATSKSSKTTERNMILVQKEAASKAKESDTPKNVEKSQAENSWKSGASCEKLSILNKNEARNASAAAASKSKPSPGLELRCNEPLKRIVKPFKFVCNSRNTSVQHSAKILRKSTSPRKKPKDEEIGGEKTDIVCEKNRESSSQYSSNSQEKIGVSLSANNNETVVNNACTEIRNKLNSCKEEGSGAAAAKEIAKDERLLDCLNVIKEALTSVTDEQLRAKALCALAECGISKAKEVPITSPELLKTVHDAQIQTDVFALLDANSFVLVKGNSPGLERIAQTERSCVVPPPVPVDAETQTDPQPQAQPMVRLKHSIDNITFSPMWTSSPMQDTLNLDDYLTDLLNDDLNANRVKQALSTPQALCKKVAKQLEKDYEEMHCWDEDGMLNIHRAVVDDQFQVLQKLLVVLQASKIDIDVLTDNGMTSLELAIKFGASKDVVELLLKAGANPLIPELLHETAVLLACKQSSPLLPHLLRYVSDSKLLNQTDSTGFAPLHYCAYSGYLEGVNALIEKGADVNLRDSRSGRTPFFHALENKHGVIAQKLLEKGAIADLPNFSGQSVLSLVDQSKNLFLKLNFR